MIVHRTLFKKLYFNIDVYLLLSVSSLFKVKLIGSETVIMYVFYNFHMIYETFINNEIKLVTLINITIRLLHLSFDD